MAKVPSFKKLMSPIEVAFYIDDPVAFVYDKIFHELGSHRGGPFDVSDQQKQILDAVARNRRVTVRAGRGIGKSATLSWLSLWWLSVFNQPKVIATAPSFPQLQSVLWPEVNDWKNKSLLKEVIEHNSKKMYIKGNATNAFAEPRTASKEESMLGLHAPNLLLLMDEAPGVEDKIYDNIAGSMTQPNNKIVLMGNPIRTSGFFYDSHSPREAKLWAQLAFSSEDTPLVHQSFIDEMESKYGRNHTIFKVHVLGEFPSGDPDAFIPLEDVEMAAARQVGKYDELNKKWLIEPDGEIEIGVDVARKGDDLTVIAIRKGYKLLPLRIKEKSKVNEVVDFVIEAIQDVRDEFGYYDTIKVKVDDSGVGGGVTDYLELDRENNIEVIPCNFGGAGNDRYENEATIMWAELRDAMPFIDLPFNDRILVEELASRRFNFSKRERQMIEPKDRYKKDFQKSPDRADAVVLCFSGKISDTKVFKHFDKVGANVIDYKHVNRYGGDKYAAIYHDKKTLLTHIVTAKHCGDDIIVCGEFSGGTPDIIKMLKLSGNFKRIIGNNDMFSKTGEDLWMQYMSNNIMITESYGYDKLGSIAHLTNMVESDMFKISSDCEGLIDEMDKWKHVTQAKDLRNGLILASSLLVSELKRTNVLVEVPIKKDFGTPRRRERVSNNTGFMSI